MSSSSRCFLRRCCTSSAPGMLPTTCTRSRPSPVSMWWWWTTARRTPTASASRTRAKSLPTILKLSTARLDPPESSHIVIVTRGHRDDMRVLRWAVNTRARYLGMIGSQAQDHLDLQGAGEGRHSRREVRQRPRAGWPGNRRSHAGRDRRGHRRGDDCRASTRRDECGQQDVFLSAQPQPRA